MRGEQIHGLMDCEFGRIDNSKYWINEVGFELPGALRVRIRNDFAAGSQVIVSSVSKTPNGFVRMFSEPMLASDYIGANQDGSAGMTQLYNPSNPTERLQQIAFYAVIL